MNWLKNILAKERTAHFSFFGQEFDLSGFERILGEYGENKVNQWSELLLEPHFLPEVEISRKADFPGFKVRPDDHCYEVVYQGRVLRVINGQLVKDLKAHWLLGQTVLIDTRLKPTFRNGEQMWQNDNLLGPITENLREQGKLPKYQYGLQSSRFGVSDLDYDNQIKPVLSEKLGLPISSLRSERAVEGIIIPQLYLHMPRKDNGRTDTWARYEEFFGGRSYRVRGGSSDFGGLAGVDWDYSGSRWPNESLRPLAVL